MAQKNEKKNTEGFKKAEITKKRDIFPLFVIKHSHDKKKSMCGQACAFCFFGRTALY